MERALVGVDHEVFVTGPQRSSGIEGVVEAQNELILRTLEGDFSHLWLIQADVEVPEGSFGSLLGFDVDVAFGVVPRHTCKDEFICGFIDEQKKVWYLPRQVVSGQILSGWVFASGCILVKRSVLKAGIRFRYVRGIGEDILFAYDVQAAGFVAKVDGRVVCGHLPEWPLPLPTCLPIFGVLDVGCGHRPKGDVNVDLFPEPTAHRSADQRVNDDVRLNVHKIVNFVVADACHLPFREGSFVKVYSWHLIEHLGNPSGFLEECCRVAAEKIEVRCPNGDRALPYGVAAYGETKPLHVSRMTREWFLEGFKSLPGWDWNVSFDWSQSEPWEIVAEGVKFG